MTLTESELRETREIVDRAMKLSRAARESVARELIETLDEVSEDVERDKQAFREELARRIEAVKNGTMKTYTVEETMDYLQTVVDEAQPG